MSRARANIYLVDDHPLVREWLANLVHQEQDLLVCGAAEAAPEALQGIVGLKPDIAIVDISLQNGSGIELIKDIKRQAPGVAVIVLSMHDEDLYAERALRAGARGYIMKRETAKNVIAAIRSVLDGHLYFSEKLKRSFAEKYLKGGHTSAGPSVNQLSDRELEVFQLIGQGIETRQIAESLHISMKTVQAFCARIKEKLKLANAAELLREAILWRERR